MPKVSVITTGGTISMINVANHGTLSSAGTLTIGGSIRSTGDLTINVPNLINSGTISNSSGVINVSSPAALSSRRRDISDVVARPVIESLNSDMCGDMKNGSSARVLRCPAQSSIASRAGLAHFVPLGGDLRTVRRRCRWESVSMLRRCKRQVSVPVLCNRLQQTIAW